MHDDNTTSIVNDSDAINIGTCTNIMSCSFIAIALKYTLSHVHSRSLSHNVIHNYYTDTHIYTSHTHTHTRAYTIMHALSFLHTHTHTQC
jgi:hypothetical protein